MENDNQPKQFRPALILVTVLVVLALAAAALPQSPAAAQNCKYKYTVQAGDTITYVANLYSTNWELIADANNLSAPYTITVGMVLCIPEGTAPVNGTPAANNDNDNDNDNGSSSKNPSLTITPGFRHIHIAVKNFPAKMEYYVRVFPTNTNVSYRIGNLRTDKNGAFEDFFELPAYVPRTIQMGVCLKNVWTDAVSCVRFNDEDVTPFISALARISCDKEGR